jgi:hypothetical protein
VYEYKPFPNHTEYFLQKEATVATVKKYMRPMLDLFNKDDEQIYMIVALINSVAVSYRPLQVNLPAHTVQYNTIRQLLLACPNLSFVASTNAQHFAIISAVRSGKIMTISLDVSQLNAPAMLKCLNAYPQFKTVVLDFAALGTMDFVDFISIPNSSVQHLRIHLAPTHLEYVTNALLFQNLKSLHIRWINRPVVTTVALPTVIPLENYAGNLVALIKTSNLSNNAVHFSQAHDISHAIKTQIIGLQWAVDKYVNIKLSVTTTANVAE